MRSCGNDAQCAELAGLLARRAAGSTVIFGGDVNRRDACAPDGLWAHRRVRRPGPRAPARVREQRPPIARRASRAGRAHRSRRPLRRCAGHTMTSLPASPRASAAAGRSSCRRGGG